MTSIYFVIFWFFLKTCSCQPPCITETLNDAEFSLNVTERFKMETGNCIAIGYKLTFPTNKVTTPYKKIWFEGDPLKILSTTVVDKVESETEHAYVIRGLPRGKYEYGFKLEWGCNQTYIFPKRVQISVSASTLKPYVRVPPLREGRITGLTCRVPHSCSSSAQVYWKWTKADGQSTVLHGERIRLLPTADDHNTTLTCVAEYNYDVINTTVTLTVKFPPQILDRSQCMIEGKLLVCVCISRGNPLPPITWPLATLTDYSVSSHSSIQTVNSTITMPAAHYHNTTVKCISSNGLGGAEIEIPLQNYTERSRQNDVSNWRQKFDAALPQLAAVCFCFNVVLIACLIIYICKQHKGKQRKLSKKMDAYASLRRADVQQEYCVIPSQSR